MDQRRKIADIVQSSDFASGEFDAECLLDRRNQPQMTQAVPVLDIVGRKVRPRDQGRVVKYLTQNGGELRVDGVGLHGIIPYLGGRQMITPWEYAIARPG